MGKVCASVKLAAFAWPFWRKKRLDWNIALVNGFKPFVSQKFFARPRQADIMEMNKCNYEYSLAIELEESPTNVISAIFLHLKQRIWKSYEDT